MEKTPNDPDESVMEVMIDFDLLDRFHALSVEIVRLALLAPAVRVHRGSCRQRG